MKQIENNKESQGERITKEDRENKKVEVKTRKHRRNETRRCKAKRDK